MTRLHVILRTCFNLECFSSRTIPRVDGIKKADLIPKVCKSLKRTLDQWGNPYRLTIVDDNSGPYWHEEMLHIFNGMCELAQTPAQGNGISLKTCYDIGQKSDSELLYFVEDDYGHYPEAIQEMVETYDILKELGVDPIMHPTDYPDRYDQGYLSYVVLGASRHWRSIKHTTGTFMLSYQNFMKYLPYFINFADYGIKPGVTEDNTINQIYKENLCFSPLPGLAHHIQYEETLNPYQDYKDTL